MFKPSIRAALTAALLAAWGPAHAAVQFELIPAATPHANITSLGGVPVLPFDMAPQEAMGDPTPGITTIPGVPSPATGSLTVAPELIKLTIPAPVPIIWANGYAGPVFYGAGATTLTLSLPPRTTAFHVFAMPAQDGVYSVTASADGGATSGAVTVPVALSPDSSDVSGFGFYTVTPGETIASIALTTNAANGLAIARFGIAQAPDAPTADSATPGAEQAQLTFTPPADTGTEPIDSYTASCTPQGGGTGITVTGGASPLTVTGLTNGVPYDCAVTATSAAGTSPASASLAVTPQAVPEAPTLDSATAAPGQATLSFTPPADTGAEPIDSYTASCTPQGGGAAITATGSASPIIVTGLTNGIAYDCTVTATSAAGTGPASASLSVTPQAAPAAAEPTPVPTLGSAALALLGLLAATLGLRRLRRQRG